MTLKLVSPADVERYCHGKTLTPFQKRMAYSVSEYIRQRDELTAENEHLKQRVKDLEDYERRASTKPSVLLVHDLAQHGLVTAYELGGVSVKSLTVYPWQRVSEALASAGRQWQDLPMAACLTSPYADTLTATRALELESKRATIQGMTEVVHMQEAIADAIELIKELAPYKERYLQENTDD